MSDYFATRPPHDSHTTATPPLRYRRPIKQTPWNRLCRDTGNPTPEGQRRKRRGGGNSPDLDLADLQDRLGVGVVGHVAHDLGAVLGQASLQRFD